VWFIETPVFSDQLYGLLADDDYRALQLALTLRPEQGVLIPKSGGLRKLRWTLGGKGKRGGLRVIYYWDSADDVIYLLFLYSKSQQEDLRPDQLRLLRRIVQEDLK
jgi:mRNA-degrading endonuclease RelE of RelBE toxin-antitoxin system